MRILLAVCIMVFSASIFAMDEEPFDLGYLAKNFDVKPYDIIKTENIRDYKYVLWFKTEKSAELFHQTMQKAGCISVWDSERVILFSKNSIVQAVKNKNNDLLRESIIDDDILENISIGRWKNVRREGPHIDVDFTGLQASNIIFIGQELFFSDNPSWDEIIGRPERATQWPLSPAEPSPDPFSRTTQVSPSTVAQLHQIWHGPLPEIMWSRISSAHMSSRAHANIGPEAGVGRTKKPSGPNDFIGHALVDPITNSVFRDPLIADCGESFERGSFDGKTNVVLKENPILKKIVDNYDPEQGWNFLNQEKIALIHLVINEYRETPGNLRVKYFLRAIVKQLQIPGNLYFLEFSDVKSFYDDIISLNLIE